jgi:hypothetical protein
MWCLFTFCLDTKSNKKIKAKPNALPPSSGQAVSGQANAHEESAYLIPYYFFDVNVCRVAFPEAVRDKLCLL